MVDSTSKCVESLTNENVVSSSRSAVIALLPRDSARKLRKTLTKELAKVGPVLKTRTWNEDPGVVVVVVPDAASAEQMVLATNGRITVEGEECDLHTWDSYGKLLEVVEGPSPPRPGQKMAPATTEDLRCIYQNYFNTAFNFLLACEDDLPKVDEYLWVDDDTNGVVPAPVPDTAQDLTTTQSICDPVPCDDTFSLPFTPSVPNPQFTLPASVGTTSVSLSRVDAAVQTPLLSFSHPTPILYAPQPAWGFLGLPPPYHNLPDTPFFRRATVIPPPLHSNDGLPTLQRITNRYLSSMQDQDDRDEMNLQLNACNGYYKATPLFSRAPGVGRGGRQKKTSLCGVLSEVTKEHPETWTPWASQHGTAIVDGSWSQSIDMKACFLTDVNLPATVVVEIRDRGTGDRGETKVDFDPLASLFDIIPMRPAFNERTKQLLFVLQSVGCAADSSISVQFTCLSDSRPMAKTVAATVDDVVTFDLPKSWNECPVIMVKATRLLGESRSRARTLMIPSVTGVKSVEAAWIELQSPASNYKVGQKLTARVPVKDSRKLNYLVLCNSQSVVSTGRARDDGSISISITGKMLGRCVLFVYSTHGRLTTDMIQFYVTEQCQASTFSSRKEMKPGQNVTFTMNGDPYGLAVLRAIDDRLNSLAVKSDSVRAKSWDFSMFGRAESRAGQARLANFVDVKEMKTALESSCGSAAPLYLQRMGACPDVKMTSSCISNFCLKVMVDKCLNPDKPTMSTACDPRNPQSCRQEVKVSSILSKVKAVGLWKTAAAVPTEDAGLEMLSDVPETDDDMGSATRERFHDVWVFDAYKLGASGTASASVTSPDSIGRWSVSSVFWSPGQKELCRANNSDIIAKKDVFMNIDLPKHVYINETITVKISVSALNLDKETKFAVCMSELSRKVCADLGSFGQHGRPTYTRMVVSKENPTDTKTFTMRFLVTGPTAVVFHLRRESSFPGKHHCEVGDVVDSVRLHLNIAKRADTEEHYKRLILSSDKPLARVAFNDDIGDEDVPPQQKHIIEVAEYRSELDPSAVVTAIHTNILDTDTVYSFTIDLSKFLPNQPSSDVSRRVRRGVLDYGNSFLSDVLKRLSAELYQFKRTKMNEKTEIRQLEQAENRIGTLLSDMLRFSDCSNETACGFAEYGRPKSKDDRSPLLTALASSLLCEASADERLVCGAVRSLQDYLTDGMDPERIDLHDMIDIDHVIDKMWFLNSLMLQVSKDCAAYQCTKNDHAWGKLYLSFYDLDETWRFDDRSLAALAFMGTNATGEIMRIKMLDNMHSDLLPFWSAGSSLLRAKSKMSTFDEVTRFKRMKSGDVLVNSLGVLAFVSSGAEGRSIEWDPLANWIYEQQSNDGTYETALDTYFASRALYEYRFRKIDLDTDSNLQVTVACPICEVRTINVTETASEIYLPTHVRNLTLTTRGHGKVKAGVRVLATKRQRSRRGLTQDDYYPVRITVDQQRVSSGIIRQTICLRVLSPILKMVEMTHGLFTGYTAQPNSVDILTNSSSLAILGIPSVSSFAVHFVLEGLVHNTIQCYQVGVSEPGHSHEPFHLAPVAIVARHPISDVVGLVLISHPDQNKRVKRATSSLSLSVSNLEQKRRRRGIVDESIDTVCFQGGACSCAETSCGVQCGACSRDTIDSLKSQLDGDNDAFGVRVRVVAVQRVLVESSYYNRLETLIVDHKANQEGSGANLVDGGRLSIWLRDCNPRCLPKDGPQKDDKYFLLGEADALAADSTGALHYVLRDSDRLEAATNDCGSLLQVLLLPG